MMTDPDPWVEAADSQEEKEVNDKTKNLSLNNKSWGENQGDNKQGAFSFKSGPGGDTIQNSTFGGNAASGAKFAGGFGTFGNENKGFGTSTTNDGGFNKGFGQGASFGGQGGGQRSGFGQGTGGQRGGAQGSGFGGQGTAGRQAFGQGGGQRSGFGGQGGGQQSGFGGQRTGQGGGQQSGFGGQGTGGQPTGQGGGQQSGFGQNTTKTTSFGHGWASNGNAETTPPANDTTDRSSGLRPILGPTGRGRGIPPSDSAPPQTTPQFGNTNIKKSFGTNWGTNETSPGAKPFAVPPLASRLTSGQQQEESWDVPAAAPTQPLAATSNASFTSQNGTVSPFAQNPDSSTEDEDSKPMPKTELSLLNKLLHDRLVESDVEHPESLQELQNDPTSPLFSITSFEEFRLSPEILKGIYAMGFSQPSKIQEMALPVLLITPPQNMIAQSQSGTGKTAAFVITMLQRVDPQAKHPQCLCIAPTYELALQIGKVVEQMSTFIPDIKVRYAVRGNRVGRGERLEEQIIIGTPGTLMDYVLKFRVIDPKEIKVFVLDEADVMISQQGHQDQSIRIYNEIARNNDQCQMLLFSATYDEPVVKFAESIIPNAQIIQLRREEQKLDNIKQYIVQCDSREDKFQAICNLYSGISIGSAIIFCHTRKSAAWIAQGMTDLGHKVALLSGELEIEDRARVIHQFKQGEYKVLITTNVCARGIDVTQVTIVINYDLPTTVDRQPDFETYLHRIGRTGRFGKNGIAVNFVDGRNTRETLNAIKNHFNYKIENLDTKDAEQLDALDRED